MTERRRGQPIPTSDSDLQSSSRRAYTQLRDWISQGNLQPGDRLVEQELTTSLATSRNAVREALGMLQDEGLISRERRNGTTVIRSMVEVDLGPLLPSGPITWLTEGENPAVPKRIERRRIPSTPYLRKVLETDADEVIMVEDLLTQASERLVLRIGYFVDDVVDPSGSRASLRREHWWLESDHASAFLTRFGMAFGHAETVFEATPAEPRTSRLLQLPSGVPILLMRSLLFDIEQRPRELAYFHYAGNLVTVMVNPVDHAHRSEGRLRLREAAPHVTAATTPPHGPVASLPDRR